MKRTRKKLFFFGKKGIIGKGKKMVKRGGGKMQLTARHP